MLVAGGPGFHSDFSLRGQFLEEGLVRVRGVRHYLILSLSDTGGISAAAFSAHCITCCRLCVECYEAEPNQTLIEEEISDSVGLVYNCTSTPCDILSFFRGCKKLGLLLGDNQRWQKYTKAVLK